MYVINEMGYYLFNGHTCSSTSFYGPSYLPYDERKTEKRRNHMKLVDKVRHNAEIDAAIEKLKAMMSPEERQEWDRIQAETEIKQMEVEHTYPLPDGRPRPWTDRELIRLAELSKFRKVS
jgi:hypothetical protein